MIADFMNAKEIATFLGVTLRRVTGLCSNGEIRNALKDSGSWYAQKKEVEYYRLTHVRGGTKKTTAKARQAAQESAGKE